MTRIRTVEKMHIPAGTREGTDSGINTSGMGGERENPVCSNSTFLALLWGRSAVSG